MLANGFALDILSGYESQDTEIEELRMAAAPALSIGSISSHDEFAF
jgi:hypothetical protein